jgi:fibronectin-binding autotransporter adhesin
MKRSLISLALLSIFIALPATAPAAIIPQGDVFPDPYTWDASTFALIGGVSVGELTVNFGSDLLADVAIIGASSTGTGVVTVDGPGSSWTITHDLFVGQSGFGILDILNGGKVTNIYGVLGDASGSFGAVSVDGPGSTWVNYGLLVIGNHGEGLLSISNGGFVASDSGSIGAYSGSTGTVTVDGTGSTWNNSSSLYVGNIGSGTLDISNDGSVRDSSCFLASSSGSSGVVTIEGTGSTWTNTGNLYVGYAGVGNVTQNGGTVSVGGVFYLGYYSHSSGTYNLNGGTLTVANISTGPVEPDTTRNFNFNGGTLQVNGSFVYPAEITSTVKTAGAKINTNGNILTINSALLHDDALGSTLDGGLIKSGAGTLTLAGLNTYTGDTRINAGTLLWGNANALQNSTLDMNAADAGTVNFNGVSAVLGGLKGSRNLSLGAITLTVGGNNQSTTYSGVLSGSGTLTKTGSGALTLGGSSANTNSGLITVNAGTLFLDKTGSATAIANGGLTIGDNSNVALVQYSGTSTNMMGTGTVTINRRGTLDFNGKTDTIGNVVIAGDSSYLGQIANTAGGGALTIGILSFTGGGSVATGTGKIILGGLVTYTADTNGLAASISGNLDLNANRTFAIADDPAVDSEMNISAVIANGSGTSARLLTKTGSGTLTLSGANTYGGGTALAAGTLAVGNDSALGSGTLTIQNGATLQAAGGARTLSNAITASGADIYVKGSNDLTLSGAITAASTCLNVENGSAVLHLTGSANRSVSQIVVGGYNIGDSGNCELSGTGQLTEKDWSYIGLHGNGTFRQTGAVFNASGIVLASSSGSRGTYELSGSAQLSAGVEIIGGSGTATFTQTSGTNTVTEFYLLYGGDGGVGDGNYYLSGTGQLFANWEYINWGSGRGTFTHTSGTNTVTAALIVGGLSEGGAYNLSGTGLLSADREYIGYEAAGTLTQSGGTNIITTDLTLGVESGSSGTYNLNGGTLVAKSISQGSGAAAFNFGGGTLQASGDFSLSLPVTLTGNGGNATVNTSGHNGTLSGALSGAGGIIKTGLGTLILGSVNTFSGDTRITAGTLRLGNPIALQNSTLDLNAADAGSVDFNGLNPVLGGLKGSRNLDLGGNWISIGKNNQSTTYSGQVSNGGFDKIGTGTLKLTANQSSPVFYWSVNQGTLIVDGQLLSFMEGLTSVMDGATLAGHGSIFGGAVLDSGAHLAPGHVSLGSIYIDYCGLISGAQLDYDFGAPGTSDLTISDYLYLESGIVLNANSLGGFAEGTYNLFQCGAVDGFIPGPSGVGTFTVANSPLTDKSYSFDYSSDYIRMIVSSLSLDHVWTGEGNNNNWTTAANWGGATPQANDPLVFDGTARLNNTNDFAAGVSFSGMTFNAGAGAFTLSGNSITLTGDIINNSSQTQTINLPLLLSGGNRTVNTSVGIVVLGGVIGESGGSCGLVKTGSSTLILSGTNVYTGGTTLSGGTLAVGNDIALGSGALTINDGTTLQASGGPRAFSNPITSANASFFVTCTQDLTLSGPIAADTSTMRCITGAATLRFTGSAARSFNELRIGNDIGQTDKIELSGSGSFNATDEIIGDWGSGDFSHTGGVNLLSHTLYLGYSPHGTGTYSLSGTGQLSTKYGSFGISGTAVFNQSGGTSSFSDCLFLGYNADGNGAYNLTGSSRLNAYDISVGVGGTGVFNHTGGTSSITDCLFLGYNSGSSGAYYLSGDAQLNADLESFGVGGVGVFNHSAGTNAVNSVLFLGYESGSSGTYNLSGSGQLASSTESIGVGGTGIFNHITGTNTVADVLFLGYESGSSGTYNLNGGTLTAKSIFAGAGAANFNFGGGTLQASGDFSISLPMTLTGNGGNATVDNAGHSATLSGVLSGAGGINKAGAGTLILGNANTYTGDTRIIAGTLRLENANAIRNSTIDLNAADAGTVDFNGLDAVLGGLKGSRDLNLGGRLITCGNNNRSTTYSGQLSNGALVKTGTGNLTLSADQTSPLFAGLVNQGTLTINGQLSSSFLGVMVRNGATLAGHGSIAGGARLDLGAHLAPDLMNLGSMRIDRGIFANGAVLDYDFGAPETSDLTVCDDLYFESGVVLNATNLGGFAVGTYNLFESESIEGFVPGRSGVGTFTLANPPLSDKIYSFERVGDYIQLIVSSPNQGFLWTGGGADNNLTTPGNWAEYAPGDGDPIDFGGTTRLSPNNNYPAGTQFNGITFLADAGAFTLDGNLIKLGDDVVNQSAQLQKINCPLTLVGGDRVIDTGTPGVTLGGAIGESGGSFGLIKRGDGLLTLSGNNTFTGTIHVEQGTLSGNTSSLRVPIENAGDVIFNQAADGVYASAFSGSGNLRKKGVAKLLVNGPLGLSGKVTVEAGTLELGEDVGASLNCNIDDYTTLLINRASMLTLNGYLRGAGGLTVQGGGELVLTQLNSLNGAVDVHNGALSILGGITLAKSVNLAPLVGESGALRIQGSGNALEIGSLAVGAAGNGSVSITDGANIEINVNQNWITLGQANGGRGAITVNGEGSSLGGGLDVHNRLARPQWLVGGKLSGTSSGVGTLIVENGASADAKSVVLGGSPQSHGNLVRVEGAGSLLTFDELCIGYSSNPGGSGQLQIADGGRAACTWRVRVGCGEASDGELSVSGTAASLGGGLDSTGTFKLPGLWIGGDSTSASGTGRVFVENGGHAELAFIMLGQGANSRNNLLQIIGAGSTVASADVVSVGYPGGGGTVLVQQAGALTVAQQIKIGAKAGSTGELRIESGGIVESHKGTSATESSGILAYEAGASGTALIHGNGSQWIQDGVLNVGYAGQGQMTIENGGLVHSAMGVIARQTGSTGSVAISNPGSRWQIDGDLHVGGEPFGAVQCNASLVVRDGGSVSVGGKIHVWNGGVLAIDADAALGVAPAETVADSISLSEGTLAASDSFALDARRGVALLSPGGIIDVTAGQELTLEGPLSGEGGLTKRGDGDLILTVVSYTGPTHIEKGNIYFQSGASRSETTGIATSLLENCVSLDSIEGNGGMIVGDSITLCVNSISLDILTIGSRFTPNGLSSGEDISLVGSSATQSVPEPNNLILLGIAVLFITLAGIRRKLFITFGRRIDEIR